MLDSQCLQAYSHETTSYTRWKEIKLLTWVQRELLTVPRRRKEARVSSALLLFSLLYQTPWQCHARPPTDCKTTNRRAVVWRDATVTWRSGSVSWPQNWKLPLDETTRAASHYVFFFVCLVLLASAYFLELPLSSTLKWLKKNNNN